MKHNKQKNKIKIGVIGENPKNDSEALITLLQKVALENIDFQVLTKNFNGSDLDGDRFWGVLEEEAKDVNKIIFIRDSDEVISEQIIAHKHKRDEWFRKANKMSGKKGIFFLAVAETEALILADIKTFNTFYRLKIQFTKNPMMEGDPKKALKEFTKSLKVPYKPSHALDIFKKLDFETVYKNHKGERSFQAFADELKKLNILDFK